ncbi:MAG: hypothetical protein H6Q18_665 [Bacteroidetes bacterium]|nr:hypothetical protein [Bacteroidota bacterium]
MKTILKLLFIFLILLNGCGEKIEPPIPEKEITWQFTPASLSIPADEGSQNIVVSSNGTWTVTSSETWCTISPVSGYNGETSLKITVSKNNIEAERTAVLTFTSGKYTKQYLIKQVAGIIGNYVPAGYNKVWSDEFNDERLSGGKPALPNTTKWWYETGAGGWGNNEIQNYISGYSGADTCAAISNGTLKIIAKKRANEVISIRMNTKESWTYGYFEARLRVPGGKGIWPAFWMMPKNFTSWPLDGEIDIMEYVGYRPNVVQASIHSMAYYHSIGTQKTETKTIQNAETEFHIYGLEWTTDKIDAYVDGVKYFTFINDKTNNKNTWPFNAPFYLKLNLAWGGNWGGSMGIDESRLPATYEIDYVRVYQK